MISYSIDSTIFIPPVLPENEEQSEVQLNQLKNNINNYNETINNCYNLITHQNSISVYLFFGTKFFFDYDYKKLNDLGDFSIDTTISLLDKIADRNFTEKEYHFGGKVENEKYYFDEWFRIKNIDKNNCILTPSLNDLITQDNKLESRLIMIGILNQYVYKTLDFHFLILNNNDSLVSVKSNINFTFLNKNYPNELLNTQVQTKQIDNITIESEKYKTVLEAYESAKNNFASYLVFGDDVNAGIKTIRDSAGPPDRIFAYLETLKDFCIYKRNYNTLYDDADIINMFGCICHHEKPESLKDKKVIDARMFDNGSGQNELFELHLCPNTFPPAPGKSRTVRIHFKWDENQKKVIIGWIGDHRCLP